MGKGNSLGNIDEDGEMPTQKLGHREFSIPLDPRPPGLATHQFHGELWLTSAVFTGVIDRNDVRMFQGGRGQGLAAEVLCSTTLVNSIEHEVLAKPLERHGAFEGGLGGLPDFTVAAAVDESVESERAIPVAGRGRNTPSAASKFLLLPIVTQKNLGTGRIKGVVGIAREVLRDPRRLVFPSRILALLCHSWINPPSGDAIQGEGVSGRIAHPISTL